MYLFIYSGCEYDMDLEKRTRIMERITLNVTKNSIPMCPPPAAWYEPVGVLDVTLYEIFHMYPNPAAKRII